MVRGGALDTEALNPAELSSIIPNLLLLHSLPWHMLPSSHPTPSILLPCPPSLSPAPACPDTSTHLSANGQQLPRSGAPVFHWHYPSVNWRRVSSGTGTHKHALQHISHTQSWQWTGGKSLGLGSKLLNNDVPVSYPIICRS